jgi:hypothetical protein
MYEWKPDVAMRIRQRMTAGVNKSCAAAEPHPARPDLTLQDVNTLIDDRGKNGADVSQDERAGCAGVCGARRVTESSGSTEADRVW